MAPTERVRLLTGAFVFASLAHFLHGLAWNMFLHLPGFLKALGAGEQRIGVIYGVAAVTAIAARPSLGRVMDTRGRRPLILAGGVVSTVICASYLLVHDLGPLIWIIRIGHGVGEAMLFASLFAYAAEIVPVARRIEGIALFGVSGMIPIGLGGLVGDMLLPLGGYRLLFITAAALAATALLLSLPLREPPMQTGEPPRGIVAALVQRDLVPLWFVGTVFATAVCANVTFISTFVSTTGIGSVGAFFAPYSAAAVVLRVVLGSLPERLGPKRVLLPAMVCMALGLAVLTFAESSAAVVVAGTLCGLGHGYTFPIVLGLVLARARPRERGAALAIYTALFDAGMLLGGPLLGSLIAATTYRTMFGAAAMGVAAGLLAFFAWDRRR
jgi:MFS family permease